MAYSCIFCTINISPFIKDCHSSVPWGIANISHKKLNQQNNYTAIYDNLADDLIDLKAFLKEEKSYMIFFDIFHYYCSRYYKCFNSFCLTTIISISQCIWVPLKNYHIEYYPKYIFRLYWCFRLCRCDPKYVFPFKCNQRFFKKRFNSTPLIYTSFLDLKTNKLHF